MNLSDFSLSIYLSVNLQPFICLGSGSLLLFLKFYLIYFIQISVVQYSLQQNRTFFFGVSIPSWVMTSNEENQSLTVSMWALAEHLICARPGAELESMQSRSLFSWSSQSDGEGGPRSVIMLCGTHHENMVSKQEPEPRKGMWGSGRASWRQSCPGFEGASAPREEGKDKEVALQTQEINLVKRG